MPQEVIWLLRALRRQHVQILLEARAVVLEVEVIDVLAEGVFQLPADCCET